MKALIITYYWPPAGGSGVQRWLKFVKYLPEFGVQPIVYVPENANYPTIDKSLLAEMPKEVTVLKSPIKNPQDVISFLKKNTHKKGVANVSKGGFLSWVRGNFFIPDAKKFWIKPSVKYLERYLKENPVDVIISTGPPHSIHLIANKIKQKTNLRWIADFRDPWSQLYYNADFNLSSYAKKKNKQLETIVLQNADAVITVSKSLKKEFENIAKKVFVITNGYDDEVLLDEKLPLTSKFSLAHIGLLPKQSNPRVLWKVLQTISKENKTFKNDLEINLIGNVNQETIEDIKYFELFNNTILKGYVPHKTAIKLQKTAQILLLLIPKTDNSKGILTGKLFEYITSKRPILALGDKQGDAATLIQETETGVLVNFDDEQQLKAIILQWYKAYQEQRLSVKPKNIEQYHRKNLTQQLSELIKIM
ncbi:glycosyltransferase family 4 protein [Tenacibaculum sp. UWU-22]|uniref:glycosyltransferase family 4 protein n=1 Tax=Tenacibaculum sp. UWU-22 TaxID=3234187 RepID=UPI0034DB36A1